MFGRLSSVHLLSRCIQSWKHDYQCVSWHGPPHHTIRDLNYSHELISANKLEQMTKLRFEEVHSTKPGPGSS